MSGNGGWDDENGTRSADDSPNGVHVQDGDGWDDEDLLTGSHLLGEEAQRVAHEVDGDEPLPPTYRPTGSGWEEMIEQPSAEQNPDAMNAGETSEPQPEQDAQEQEEPTATSERSATPFATPSMMPPPKEYAGDESALASHHGFRRETFRLARSRDFLSIAALHEAALQRSTWAETEETQANLLLDLARLYQDKLSDQARTIQTFERLVSVKPGHREAMEYLRGAYESTGNMKSLHSLYARAVENEWAPDRRVALTREAARIALDRIHDPTLAAKDWERLLELGEMDGQVTVELSKVYRQAGRWSDLGEFLKNRAEASSGTTQIAILREAAEAFLSGAQDPDAAEAIVQQIVQREANDAIGLATLALVQERKQRWNDLRDLAMRPIDNVASTVQVDLLRLVASLLQDNEQYEMAGLAFDRILEKIPDDKDAWAAKEQELRRRQDYDQLVQLLVLRTKRLSSKEERCTVLGEAAKIASDNLNNLDMAQSLWKQAIESAPERKELYEHLGEVCERNGDTPGLTHALEGLLAISTKPGEQRQVLRRLGRHYAYQVKDDENAQRCWLRLSSLSPHDPEIKRELNEIHRRRQDFVALDKALCHQQWHTTNRDEALALSVEIARNLDQNLNDSVRSVRAWQHVLDLDPGNREALDALATIFTDEDTTTQHAAALEANLTQLAPDADSERHQIGLQIAAFWEKRQETSAAIAAYERVRTWDPTNPTALAALLRLYGAERMSAAMSVLEVASSAMDSPSQAREVIEQALSLVPEDQPKIRYFLLTRLLKLSQQGGIGAIVEAATSAESWGSLAALYERLNDREHDDNLSRTMLLRSAQIAEEHMENPSRAFVLRQALSMTSPREDDLTDLRRLAATTKRWEDFMGVLGASISSDTPKEKKQALLLERAQIAEQHLEDPQRAFFELQRLIEGGTEPELDETERQALEQMHRLAQAHGLFEELLWFYGILWDRASDDDARLAVTKARRTILEEHLNRPMDALEQALLVLRLRPNDEEVLADIMSKTEELSAWTQTVPILEGLFRALAPTPQRLQFLANLYEQRAQQPGRAVELLAQALVGAPEDESVQNQLQQLSDSVQLWPRVAFAYRLAASRCDDTDRASALAHGVASIYADRINDPDASLDVQRWILQRWPADEDALEHVIDYHRKEQNHSELRERLEQWTEVIDKPDTHKDRWLEIGRLCRDHLQDTAGQLVAFSHVLDLDSENEEAAEAIGALGDVSLPPTLRAKQVRLELTRADNLQKAQLLEQLADIEREQGNPEAAIEALRERFAMSPPNPEATAKLIDLLRDEQRWEELVSSLETASEQTEDPSTSEQLLKEAVQIAQAHGLDAANQERLLRKLLDSSQTDQEPFVMLVRVLRRSGRWEDLASLLEQRITEHTEDHEPFELENMTRVLTRLLALGLERNQDAEKLLRQQKRQSAGAGGAALWLAKMALDREDHVHYLELRRQQAMDLPDRLCALVLCHLAEHCDQHMQTKGRVLSFYREARAKDPQNNLANEGLRGLGRGVKTWRASAALLPVPNEANLSRQERAERLRAMGAQAQDTDPLEARGWYERAVAVNPDDVRSWDALTAIGIERREYDYALMTATQALYAYERTAPPVAEQDEQAHAQRMARVAGIAHMARNEQQTYAFSQSAFAEYPDLPAAAMLVADANFERGGLAKARALYSHLLDHLGDALSETERSHVLQRRALGHLREGHLPEAREDVRSALAIRPLFPPALDTMAEVLRRQGRPVLSAIHELRALLVTEETDKRGVICAHIGRLCDEELQRPGEGGAWFELAVQSGVEDRHVMRRVLQHFRDTDRAKQALIAIADLIENTTDSEELAELWAMRGAILLDENLEEAEEALDVALSFDPSHDGAHRALRQVLERKGDFEQLSALLDARADSGPTSQRVESLEELVTLCFEKLDDKPRGESYLQRLVNLDPSPKYVRRMLDIVQNDPEQQQERLPLLARLVELGDETSSRIIEIGRILNAEGKHHLAWAVLSSLMGATPVEPWVKTALTEYRRSFERFDSIGLLRPFLLETLGVLPQSNLLSEVLDTIIPKVLDVSVPKGGLVDARTGPGRVLQRIEEALAIDANVLRVSSLDRPLQIIPGDMTTLALKTDILSAPPGEMGFIITYGLALARPACATFASVPTQDREALLDAFAWAVAGIEPASRSDQIIALRDAITTQFSAEEIESWTVLTEQWDENREQALSLWQTVELAALRVACIAAGDARTAMRAIARLDNMGRPPGVTRVSEFDKFFASSAMVRRALGFIASDMFSRIMTASA